MRADDETLEELKRDVARLTYDDWVEMADWALFGVGVAHADSLEDAAEMVSQATAFDLHADASAGTVTAVLPPTVHVSSFAIIEVPIEWRGDDDVFTVDVSHFQVCRVLHFDEPDSTMQDC